MTGPWVAAFLVLWVVVAALTLVLIGLVRRVALLLQTNQPSASSLDELSQLPLLAQVPNFSLLDPELGPVSLDAALEETSIILLTRRGCRPCATLLDGLESLRTMAYDLLPLIVISDEPHQENGAGTTPAGYRVLYDPRNESATVFRTPATPYAFVLSADRLVLEKRIPEGVEDLFDLSSNQMSRVT